MQGKETKHLKAFVSSKQKSSESVEAHLEGWIGDMMGTGDKTQRNGQFIVTNERVCFYRKGILGEVFETIPMSLITSTESLSRMGYRLLRLHTSHDDLEFKTFEAKELFDSAFEKIESIRQQQKTQGQTLSVNPSETVLDQIKKLGELHDAGILTSDEFQSKKLELLAKL